MKRNRQGLSLFSVVVFALVCMAHAGVFYCAARFTPTVNTTEQEKIVKLEVVSLNESKPAEIIPTEQVIEQPVKIPDQKIKTESHPPKKSEKELTAPKQAPEKQLAAKSQEPIKTEQKPQLAQQQTIQTTQTDQPGKNAGYSATSLTQGEGNKTVTKAGIEKTGSGSESASPKNGRENNGGGADGGKTQKARWTYIDKSYPENLRRNNVTGRVTFGVLVGANGKAQRVSIMNSTNAKLNSQAIRSVRQGRYLPEIKNGQTIEKEISFSLSYELNGVSIN